MSNEKGKLQKELKDLIRSVQTLPVETQESILDRLLKDPLLSDLPVDLSPSLVGDIIGFETGQTFSINIIKYTGEIIRVYIE